MTLLSRVLPVLSFSILPVLVMIIGSGIAAYRVPTPAWRSLFQNFAAGVVLAAVAGELLPEITRGHHPVAVILGFALGVAVLLLIRHFAAGSASNEEVAESSVDSVSGSFVFVIGLDVFIDGLLIGVGFAAGERVGRLLTVALGTELLFLGLSTVSALMAAGVARAQAVRTTVTLALMVLVGATLGALALTGLQGFALVAVLSFGAAALLYLVTEELLVEAHEVRATPWSTGAFFTGFVVLYLTELLL